MQYALTASKFLGLLGRYEPSSPATELHGLI